ncbi:aliphatic amidase expression-regulating protein AmiC [Octadecabacter antarcticus 307]|uniref:Aliphatic amidase expression-regulating protein AmiC n=1 Tax=Octadecabacter antarcticus 307 TaxID=391626 RepID=M9R786_9RHOB|nr:transporter substrate-binding domain-containing protein [Octadecabacter antarcticus]AGI67633.1 aliphatic amidase expression-regulating protein AmiC [Octadecabacter antarcticus 307]
MKETVKVGVLFSQTGSMAVTETAHINGVLLACEEINEGGGIRGRQIEPILMNPEGDDRKYAEMATDLLVNYGVKTIFGCCLSTSRKAVLPLIERFDGVLFYPSVYEGFEYSPNVIYGGAVPNQIVPPLLEYVFEHHGRSISLIGSDTLYAREINRIVKEFLSESGGDVVAEVYLPFSAETGEIRAAIAQCGVDQTNAVLSTMVGGDSVALYDLYAESGLREKSVPIASLTTTETELMKVGRGARSGHISIASYFASVETPQNPTFVSAFQEKYGVNAGPSVYSEVGYSLVHFYANAARLNGKVDTRSVLQALSGSVFKAPGGDLSIDMDTNHFTLRPHIGLSRTDGTFDVVWDSPKVAAPDPYLVAYDRSITTRVAG